MENAMLNVEANRNGPVNPVLHDRPIQRGWLGRMIYQPVHSGYQMLKNSAERIVEFVRAAFDYLFQRIWGRPVDLYTLPRYVSKLSDRRLMAELANVIPNDPEMSNTGLTEILQRNTFLVDDHKNEPQINQLLQELAHEAIQNNNKNAQRALTCPNNQGVVFDEDLTKRGIPKNTPLCLLVKMGNFAGAQFILPVYQRKDLLSTTPRGNSVLHLAAITGQMKLAFAIMDRANELGMLEELVNLPNRKGFIAKETLAPLLDLNPKNTYRNFLDMAIPFLGGEEINKALITQSGDSLLCHHRNLLLNGITALENQISRVENLKEMTLIEIWQQERQLK
jgi:hypothetical protein